VGQTGILPTYTIRSSLAWASECGSRFGSPHRIFNPNAAEVFQVSARFDGDRHAGLQPDLSAGRCAAAREFPGEPWPVEWTKNRSSPCFFKTRARRHPPPWSSLPRAPRRWPPIAPPARRHKSASPWAAGAEKQHARHIAGIAVLNAPYPRSPDRQVLSSRRRLACGRGTDAAGDDRSKLGFSAPSFRMRYSSSAPVLFLHAGGRGHRLLERREFVSTERRINSISAQISHAHLFHQPDTASNEERIGSFDCNASRCAQVCAPVVANAPQSSRRMAASTSAASGPLRS